MTVGLLGGQGDDVLAALQLDLDALEPDFLGLIASGQSGPNARRMVERCALPPEQCEIVVLNSAHDLDEVFRETNALIRRLIERGYRPDQIAVNYTSGTKVMGSGAVLAAVSSKLMELRYVKGLASVREGPADARHRLLTTQPAAVMAYQDLLSGWAMLRDLRYRSAVTTLQGSAEKLLSPDEDALRGKLIVLSRAYACWDAFHPEKFLELYGMLEFDSEWLMPFRLTEGPLDRIRELARERQGGQPGPCIITDMFNNAVRRLHLDRAEDALTRLYRALEMLAQWVLWRDFGIDTNQVDTRRIPPRDRVAFEAMRSMEDGLVKIGLRKAFDLLSILNTRVGRHIGEDPVMKDFLGRQGQSILAHGLHPADSGAARRFLCHARRLFGVEIEGFEALAEQMQFPWLQVRDVESSEHAAISEGPGDED